MVMGPYLCRHIGYLKVSMPANNTPTHTHARTTETELFHAVGYLYAPIGEIKLIYLFNLFISCFIFTDDILRIKKNTITAMLNMSFKSTFIRCLVHIHGNTVDSVDSTAIPCSTGCRAMSDPFGIRLC